MKAVSVKKISAHSLTLGIGQEIDVDEVVLGPRFGSTRETAVEIFWEWVAEKAEEV